MVTDSTGLAEDKFLAITEEALVSGVTMIQLREKDKSAAEYIRLAHKVHTLAQKYNVPLIIDDRADVALEVDAEGVHLGQEDISVETARRILGEDKIIGVSAKTVPQALTAFSKGADYIGSGAVYPTATKVKTVRISVDTIREICKAVTIPVNAIGGLNKDNIGVLKGSGISGICVVSAIMRAENTSKAVAELKIAVEELLFSTNNLLKKQEGEVCI